MKPTVAALQRENRKLKAELEHIKAERELLYKRDTASRMELARSGPQGLDELRARVKRLESLMECIADWFELDSGR